MSESTEGASIVKEIPLKTQASVGWSLLHESLPANQTATPASFMREKEILDIEKNIQEGKKVFIYGNDGYGKTTLLSELEVFYKNQNRSSQYLSVRVLRDQQELGRTLEYLKHIQELPKEKRPIIMFDSADYLWEQTDETTLLQARNSLYEFLLSSDLDCVLTFHKDEPKGKKTDLKAKLNTFERTKQSHSNNIIEINLYPDYLPEKVQGFLVSVGFNPELAELISKLNYTGNHAALKNYFLKELYEKKFAPFLNNLFEKAKKENKLEDVREYVTNIFRRYNKERVVGAVLQPH